MPIVWGVLIGIMAVVLIVLLVAMAAKVLGIISDNSWDVDPSQRSVKSKLGGKLLCSASCFSIILGCILRAAAGRVGRGSFSPRFGQKLLKTS